MDDMKSLALNEMKQYCPGKTTSRRPSTYKWLHNKKSIIKSSTNPRIWSLDNKITKSVKTRDRLRTCCNVNRDNNTADIETLNKIIVNIRN